MNPRPISASSEHAARALERAGHIAALPLDTPAADALAAEFAALGDEERTELRRLARTRVALTRPDNQPGRTS